MDLTRLKESLRTAKAIVSTHGIMKYMRDYDRRILEREVDDSTHALRYEFSMDPTKVSYSSENFSVAINIDYDPSEDYDHEGAIHRKYTRKVSLSYGHSEMKLSMLPIRENFIKTLAMVGELLESVLPSSIVVVVRTAEEVADRKARREEQQVGQNIHQEIGWPALKGLRKGGKCRLVRLPDSYMEKYGASPQPGSYRYEQVRRSTRRGVIREKATYLFRVYAFEGATNIKIFRTG